MPLSYRTPAPAGPPWWMTTFSVVRCEILCVTTVIAAHFLGKLCKSTINPVQCGILDTLSSCRSAHDHEIF